MDSNPQSPATKHTVLIIDDTPANVAVLADDLVDQGFAVIVAQEGSEGIERARLAQPDIILLDVVMPGMDGFETCRRLKAEAATRDIPVIFMTILADTGDKIVGFQAGGVDYVTKPFQVEEVRARIQTHLALQSMRIQLAEQNRLLQQEIAARQRFEAALQRAREELEDRVVQRTVELSDSRARLAAILDSALDAIITIDENQCVILFNAAAERMFGWSAREIIGGSLDRLLPERFRARHGEHIRHFAESGASQRAMGQGLLEVVGLRTNGEEFPVDASISKAESAGQRLFTVILRDITARKRAEEERQARLAAEAADRAKTELLANMSHELRSPLNTILGFTRLLTLEPVLPESMRDDLGLILKSGEHLHALINDVLDMTKLEAGRMIVNETSFDLEFLIDEVRDMLTPSAVDKGLQLIFPARRGVPAYVRADPLKLRQILINLINNSIKFTQQGEISVQVTAAPPDPESAATRLEFTVADTGAGIDPEEIPHLFTAFAQARAGRQAQEGTGLGLAISRRFVELMGGEMHLDSQLGRGTTIRFDIPVHVVDALYPGESSGRRRVVGLAPGQPSYRLLAVDDHPEARQLLVRLLKPLGFEVREAANGQEAIEVWREWQPHLIWMDMRMPVLDGRDAARRIRLSDQAPRPVIIALTASAFEEERSDVLAAGCDDLVRKPFRPTELFAVLERQLGVRFVYEDESPAALPPQLSAAALAALADGLRGQLEQALVHLDTKAVQRVIDLIRGQDPGLADSLAEAAGNFQYDRILAMLHAVAAEKPQEPNA